MPGPQDLELPDHVVARLRKPAPELDDALAQQDLLAQQADLLLDWEGREVALEARVQELVATGHGHMRHNHGQDASCDRLRVPRRGERATATDGALNTRNPAQERPGSSSIPLGQSVAVGA